MSLSIFQVNQIFGKYGQQVRMAELNRKTPVKTIQGQVDRVTISPEALKKRAIDATLATIQASNQASTETKPASGDDAESTSYTDEVIQNALNKSRELKKKEGDAYENALKQIREEKEKATAEEAAMKKQKELDEATPF